MEDDSKRLKSFLKDFLLLAVFTADLCFIFVLSAFFLVPRDILKEIPVFNEHLEEFTFSISISLFVFVALALYIVRIFLKKK